jgi:uncharacterized membrane protein YesL
MGLFDRFYYGKAGKADYTPDDLPANRFQLFREVLRVRLWSLMRLNLLQLIFWLPMILLTLATLIGVNALAGEIAESGGDMAESLAGILSTYALLLVPCLLITGPSTAAAARVARNWARDQHAFLWGDFKDAFKENWKQGLCVSAITGVLPLVLVVGVRFYGALAATMPVAVVAQALLVLTAAFWALALVFLYPLMIGYALNLRGLLRNGVMLALGRLPYAAAIRLATLLPLLLAAIALLAGSLWGVLIVGLYYALIGFALHRLVYASFANGVFDRFINPRIQGAPVNLGLRLDDQDDQDEG